MIEFIRRWYRKRTFQPGRVVSRFLAPDVRREVDVLDASKIDAGVLIVRTRTWNLLHAAKGLEPKPPFSEPRTVTIESLWSWSGESWGGPIPGNDQ